MKSELCAKISRVFEKIGLPTRIPADISAGQIIDTLRYDNKRRTARNDFFLLEDFTRFHRDNGKIGTKVPEELLRRVLESSY